MITELQIEGFKSFGSPAQRLQLGSLNFVVGPNASGKTNLLSALRFIQNAVMQSVEYAANDLGGALEVRNKILRQRNQLKPVRFRLHFENQVDKVQLENETWELGPYTYELQIDLRGDAHVPRISSETLHVGLKHDGQKSEFILKRDKSKVEITDPMRAGNGANEIPVPEAESARPALAVGFFALPCVVLRQEISRWRFYNIVPSMARQPSREVPDADLGPAGENLAVILHEIEKKRKADLEAIVSGLRGVVPGFKNLKTTQLPVERKWAFQILEEKIRGAINPGSVSDGTIRLLALMVITTWTRRHSSLVAIEEPENGVHPHLSEHIVGILRNASKQRQLIVTTHNPNFLDFLEPKEVFLCDKLDGFTKIRRANDVGDVETFRKRFTLGELWIQGTLGGIP